MKIDGREIANNVLDKLEQEVAKLREQGIVPNLAIILIGDDPASVAYVNRKKKKAEEIGCKAIVLNYEVRITNQELEEKVNELNQDNNIHGIIVQRPLPKHIDSEFVNQAVDPAKDVDAFHSKTKFQMPLAAAVLKILEHIFSVISSVSERSLTSFEMTKDWLKTKNIVVIGKGETGGGPVISLLRKMNITPYVIDSKTANSELITTNADIIISTVGKPNILKANDLRQNAIIIGVGMHKGKDGKLHGDYNEDEIKNIASFYTPVPGGVGPVNVAMLLKNLVEAASSLILRGIDKKLTTLL